MRLLLLLSSLIAFSHSSTPICRYGFTLINNKCLMLSISKLSHSAAEATCAGLGATLVTVKNSDDNRAISTIAASVPLVWIGLYCFDSDPSKCLWDDSTGSAESYNSFSTGFPLTEVGKCVYYSTQGALAGKWLSGDCVTDTRAFVCELPYTYADDCFFNYNGFCFSFHSTPATFPDAQFICEQECGNLASISSANENRYLSINLDPSFTHNYNCMTKSNVQRDTDVSGFWFGVSCTTPYSFICKRPAGVKCNGSVPPVTVTPVLSNPSNCNSSLLFAPGVITTPNYPKNYDNNVLCTYNLATLGSNKIRLRFTHFNTEECCDTMSVYDGDSISSPRMGYYGGSLSPFSLVSTGNTMTLRFQSNQNIVASGIRATFAPFR
uniref:C-type LECtin n=2 Tax=Caenorhabditis tropicalis TaxID=1561998 RepID=A0A1I7U563_9PELO